MNQYSYIKKRVSPLIFIFLNDKGNEVTVSLPRGWIQEIKRMYPVLLMHGL
jgi:hypothetical protein